MKILSTLATIFGLALLACNVQAAKSIQIATEASYPPFEYMDASGQIQGFDIDLANALCKEIKADCKFVNAPWDSLIPSLQLGKYDALIGSIAITPERQKQVDFTNSYYDSTVNFVAAKDAHVQISKAGLKGKTVGIQGGTTFANYLKGEFGTAVKISNYGSEQDAFLDLKAGRVDAVLGDTPTVNDWIKKFGDGKYEIVGPAINDPKYFGAGNGIAVRKGNKELLDSFNAALATIKKNGKYQMIYAKYFK